MPTNRPGAEGWSLQRRTGPQLKELTIMLGDSDLYIHMSRRIDLGNGHLLYEAVLTDQHGSRAIYIDHEDIVDTLQSAFAPAVAEKPAEPAPGFVGPAAPHRPAAADEAPRS